MKILHVDIETYSSVDLKKSGSYKYAESTDFEILCVAYSYEYTDDKSSISPVYVYAWEDAPASLKRDLQDPNVLKMAHNAAFERTCFAATGLNTGNNWLCTAVLCGYNGLPLPLKEASAALELGEKSKSSSGVALIRYFCVPVKPTKANGGRFRNLPHHDTEKWQQFMDYCQQDVVAEMTIYELLKTTLLPENEQRAYEIDQLINDRGIHVDIPFIKSVLYLNTIDRDRMEIRAQEITGLSNPNSPVQLKRWIKERTGETVTQLTKETLEEMSFDDAQVMELLDLRKRLSRTSIKKYDAMLNCAMDDERVRGLFQFYGASKTGREAGRLVQVQNLPKNYIDDLDTVRKIVMRRDYDLLCMLFDDVQDILVQLIRTAFIPGVGSTHLTGADYSAIEARVVAWLAGEQWRMEVFTAKEKKDIYKESASRMFGKPVEKIDVKDRQKGKIAELALGYQGAVGALIQMGADKMGITEAEMQQIVSDWREANPAIVKFWYDVQKAAIQCIKSKRIVKLNRFVFNCDDTRMTITLPSGRILCYWKARLVKKRFSSNSPERDCIQYLWADTNTKHKWMWVDTYGGKLVENLTQAVARDFMYEAIVRIADAGHQIVMHVHDEINVENGNAKELEALMKVLPAWAEDFPIEAVGAEMKYYQK